MVMINRELREKQAERLLRRLRQRIFDYEDQSRALYEKASRIMAKCQDRLRDKNRRRRERIMDRMLQNTPSTFEPGSGLVK